MSEVDEFDQPFNKYKFEWMTKEPSRYTLTLIKEIYVAYQDKIKVWYPHGLL